MGVSLTLRLSTTGLLLILPTLATEKNLRGEEVDGEMDSGMNGGLNGEMNGGMNGRIYGHRLLKVKHVCAQTYLRKEKDCLSPCLFDRNEQ